MDIEKNIEQYFVRQVKAAGGWPLKLTCPGTPGVPDRMVLWPDGVIHFVEMKRPGGKLRPLQIATMNRMREMGCNTFMIDRKEAVDLYVSLMGLDEGGDAK